MSQLLSRFAADEFGATSIEYALLSGIIGLGVLVGFQILRNAILPRYSTLSTDLAATP